MAGVNKAILIGNLGKDPEFRHTANGKAVCSLSLATTSKWTDSGGNKQEHTEWHTIIAWQRLAEICQQYLAKGSKVYFEGEIKTRSWDDARSGQKKYRTEIIAQQMVMLDTKASTAPRVSAVDGGGADDQDDDLPF